MKLIILLFLTLLLSADETVILKIKGKGAQSFTKVSSSSRAPSFKTNDEVTYYKNGVKDEKAKFVASRELFISFGKSSKIDYVTFASKHKLQYMREINRLYKTALFKSLSSKDIIEVANSFNLLDEVRLAQPNFKRYRELR